MNYTEEQLANALQNADAAGDVEAARMFAGELSKLREADPFPTVPRAVDGVELTEDERAAFAEAQGFENQKDKNLFAARLAGRLRRRQAETDDSVIGSLVNSQFGAGLRGFANGLFGAGDLAGATGTYLRDQAVGEGNMSFGDALEMNREFRRALEEDFPLTSGIAEVTGAVTGGGLAVTAGKQVAGRVGIRGLESALTLQKGQRVRNVAKASAAGATGGAITTAAKEGDPATGGAIGAVGGPLGLGLAKAAQVGVDQVRKLLESSGGKYIRNLAKKIGEQPDELARRFLEFRAVTGRPPAIKDIINPQAVAELRDEMARHPTAVAAATDNAERSLRTTAREASERLTGPQVRSTQTRQMQTRDTIARDQFAKANKDQIEFSEQEVQSLISDPATLAAMPPPLRRRIVAALEDAGEGNGVTLSGLDVNDLRMALRSRAEPKGANRVYDDIADELEDIARDQSVNFGRAIDEFYSRSVRGEGITAGRKLIDEPASEAAATVRKKVADANPNELAGIRVGARSEVSDRAAKGASSTESITRDILEDTALARNLELVLPPDQFRKLRRAAEVYNRSVSNTRKVAPNVRVEQQATFEAAVKDVISAGVIAGGNTGGAFKATFTDRIIRKILPRVGKKKAERIANDLFDPSKTAQVIAVLERAGIQAPDLVDMMAVSVTSGNVTSDFLVDE